MALRDQIMEDMKSAMKSKEQDKLSALRFLQSAIKNKEIEVRPNSLTDDDVMGVIKKLVKQHKDSIEQFEKADRKDLAEKEKHELSILEFYLPAQLSREETEKIVDQAISSLNATSIKQMGAVMKEVVAKTSGAVDNRLVSEIVKAKLQ